MKYFNLTLVILITLTACHRNAHTSRSATISYAETVKSAVSIFSWDLKDYYFRSTPVGSFGIGTMYLKESNSTDPKIIESHWLLSYPPIWFEDTIPETTKKIILKRVFADGAFGNVNITGSTKDTTTAKLSLPILESLSLTTGLDLQKGVSSTITVGKAVLRKLVWTEFEDAIVKNKFSSTLTKVYNRNNYSIAASDIVLRDFKVIITVNKLINPALDLKLNQSVGVIGKDGFGTLKLKKISDGKYEAAADEDVIAAILFKDPPPIQDRSGNVSEWKNATINQGDISKIESYVSGKK